MEPAAASRKSTSMVLSGTMAWIQSLPPPGFSKYFSHWIESFVSGCIHSAKFCYFRHERVAGVAVVP